MNTDSDPPPLSIWRGWTEAGSVASSRLRAATIAGIVPLLGTAVTRERRRSSNCGRWTRSAGRWFKMIVARSPGIAVASPWWVGAGEQAR